eukprot:scaffold159289_cov37-Prasinocladus_malaysianus.AAC.2
MQTRSDLICWASGQQCPDKKNMHSSCKRTRKYQYLLLHHREDWGHLIGVHIGVGGHGGPVGSHGHRIGGGVELVEEVRVVGPDGEVEGGLDGALQGLGSQGGGAVLEVQAGAGGLEGGVHLLGGGQLDHGLALVRGGGNVFHQPVGD